MAELATALALNNAESEYIQIRSQPLNTVDMVVFYAVHEKMQATRRQRQLYLATHVYYYSQETESRSAFLLNNSANEYIHALSQQLNTADTVVIKAAFEKKREALYEMQRILDELKAHIQEEESRGDTGGND